MICLSIKREFLEEKHDDLLNLGSGEHEGYWKDAVLRGAFLIANPEYKESAD